MKNSREYTFHESTTSICSVCCKRIPAKIIIENQKVYVQKHCPEHGWQKELLEDDAGYHLNKRKYDKPGTATPPQTPIDKGCPFDCGLCPEHDQHSCIGLIEITNQCDLKCKVCYADSGKKEYLSLETIEEMLDFYVETEGGDAEILQISGGEPTMHPDILDIIKLVLQKNIRYIMLNTNGKRIAEDKEFVKQLGQFDKKFEVYLQFDGFRASTYEYFRGKDLSDMKLRAIENLLEQNLLVTLVTTVERGINDDEIGEVIRFGMDKPGIRGINFQPTAYFGRNYEGPPANRMTLSGIIQHIKSQVPDVFKCGDIIPLPCNVERVGVSYLIRDKKGKFTPLTRKIKVDSYLPVIDNTFAFDVDRMMEQNEPALCDCFKLINDLSKLIPKSYMFKSKKQQRAYLDKNTFRISITSFVDKYNFDMKSIQKECVHILTPEKKRIPFSAFNLFHR